MKLGPKHAESTSIPECHVSPGYPSKGFRIDDYVIADTLGRGSMATVYLARDRAGHEVALKVFQEGPGISATMLERFIRETEASRKLRRHPNIITIYDTGQDGPYHYIAMERIDRSKTLEMALESSSMSVQTIIKTMIKIARALQYAHTHRIIHRDVKPSNIMIDEFGEPQLTDFGVAELIDLPSCTLTGALTGTPLYMSPEQARGERVGASSDIYSMGVVLFEALTGVLPYAADHRTPVKKVIDIVQNESPRRPRLFRKEISPDLEAVILNALEKAPKDRYVDAEAFAVDLERVLAGRPVSAHRFSPLDQARHLLRRYRNLWSIMGFLVSLLVAASVVFYWKLSGERSENLLREAHLKNLEHKLTMATEQALQSGQVPQAWQEIRMARREMMAGNWPTAASQLQSAVDLSRAIRDERTAAIALMDQARCEAMLGEKDSAMNLYRQIITNLDASPVIASSAQLEALELALLEGDRQRALAILQLHALPAEGPMRQSFNCLGWEIPADELLAAVGDMPRRFQNDALLAAAIRLYADGEVKRARNALYRCIQDATPPSEWPSPFARLLYNTILD